MSDGKPTFNFLINQIMRICKSATNRNDKLLKICKLLHENFDYYNWVGFYFAEPEKSELTLGPFIGAPTEHIKIPFGTGICGQAAETLKTFVVQDVTKEMNYLSCSPTVKAEIVIPIIKANRIVAELDIDSHELEPFSSEDREFLENIAKLVAQLF